MKLTTTIGTGIILGIAIAIWGVNRNDPKYPAPHLPAQQVWSTPVPDRIVQASDCVENLDAAPLLQWAIDEAVRLQSATTPSSDAAAFDEWGATIEVRFGPTWCSLGATLYVPSGSHNLVLSGLRVTGTVGVGQDSVLTLE